MNPDRFITIPQVIARAREAGFDFGSGNPVNLIHHYARVGLLPKATRTKPESVVGHTVGCYSERVVGRLLEIQNLRRQGWSTEEIKNSLNKPVQAASFVAEKETIHNKPEAGKEQSKKESFFSKDKERFFTNFTKALGATAVILASTLVTVLAASGGLGGLEKNDSSVSGGGAVLAAQVASESAYLEINADTVFNGKVNLPSTGNSFTVNTNEDTNFLTVVGGVTLDQSLSKASSPTFANLTLAAGTLVLTGNTQTLTNKTLSGSSNTFSSIPNSALSNSKVTVTAGTNLSGGGDVSLGSSVTLNLKDNISLATATFSGNLGVVGDATVSGTLSTGGRIMPLVSGVQDIGSSALLWGNIYASNFFTGSSGTAGFWQRNSGALSPTNITDDLLLGATATSSAKFTVSGLTGSATTSGTLGVGGEASLSAKLILGSATPQINAVNNRNLQFGFQNTGRIEFLNANNFLSSTALSLASGSTYQINGTDVLSASTLGSGVITSSLTTVGALVSGSIASGFGTISTANTITGTTLNATTGVNTGAGAGTNRLDSSGNLVNIGSITATGTLTNTGSATVSGTLGAGAEASISGKLVLDSATAQINAVRNQNLQLGFQNTGQVQFFNSSNYIDSSGNMYLAGNVVSSGGISGFWQRASGAMAPVNITDSVIIGRTATPSGAITTGSIQLYGVNNLTPVASISAVSSVAALVVDNRVGDLFTASSSGLNRFVVTQAGNVGIGTTGPAEKLDVNGFVANSGTTGLNNIPGAFSINDILSVAATSSAYPAFRLNATTGQAAAIINQADSGGDLFTASAAGTVKFVINKSGNVGIGTGAPGYALDVAGGVNLTTGNVFSINGSQVLSATTLGSGVTASSLTSVGTLTGGTWNAIKIATGYGGTGQDWSAVFQGNIPYFSATGVMSTLTPGTANQILTTGGASTNPSWSNISSLVSGTANQITVSGTTAITLATPQNIGTASTPTFGGLTLNGNLGGTTATFSGTLGVGGEASLSAKLILGGTTPQIDATNNRYLDLGFANTGRIEFLNTSNYIDQNNNFYLAGSLFASGSQAGFWQRTTGSLAPVNVTDPLNLGATATSSALTHLGATANEVSFFNSGGGLAIGQTSAAEALDINGRIHFAQVAAPGVTTDKLYNLTGSLAWAGNALCTAAGNCAGTGSNLGGSGAANYISKWSSTYNLTTSLLYDTGTAVGINTITPLGALDVRGVSGTTPVSTVSGTTSFAALVVDNKGVGDLFTASSSGLNRFVITQAGKIGVGTGAPVATALLDLTSTTLGFLGPRMTTTQRDAISTPATGLMIYNTTTNQYNVYSGSSWGAVGGGGASQWQIDATNGLIVPYDVQQSFGVGSTATASAFFVVDGTTGFLSNPGTSKGLNNIPGSLSINDILSVAATSSAYPAFRLNATTGQAAAIINQADAGGDLFTASAAGIPKFVINKTGQVGIGTGAPGYALDIAGGVNLSTSNAFSINGTSVLNATTLGSGVTASSLTSVGTVTGGTWNATAIGTQYGGTGQNWSAVAQGNVPYFSAAGTMSTLTPGTANQVLLTGGASANPSWGNISSLVSGTANQITVSGTTGITLSLPSNISATNATFSGTLGVGGEASFSGKITIDSLTAQINATKNRSLDLGFMNTGRINFMTTSSYVDASGNLSTNGQIRVGNMSSAPTALGAGSLYWDTTSNALFAYNGTSWSSISDSLTVVATNTSGGTLAARALVIFDTSNNNSVTTTTTAYKKATYGVNVASCANSASCSVKIAGSTTVTITNTSTVAKGDYVYTSATAGSAVTSAKQFDGMIGTVTDTSTSGSGYVTVVFAPQAQVTAGVAIDKGSRHNEYWNLAKNYLPGWDGTSPNQNIPPRGIMFDNFSDLTKTDSANTTVGGASGSAQVQFPQGSTLLQGGTLTGINFPTAPFRVGLSGGQTYATSTTDNAGNTYLGSNTVNKVFYYDRTRDSSPQVQVELGMDPNWYNGVTLAVATTSANFSQNTVIVKNPSLSTIYNGSLVKVTGTYGTTAATRTIYITITGNGNSFSWTDYNGNSGTAAMTPGTAQTLTGAGTVAVTFTNRLYNPGDVFKIASWFVEPSGSTRGSKAQFPERVKIVAESNTVDIIDADTQKLWMRFSQGTGQAIGTATTNTPNSTSALNGKIYSADNGATGALYTLDFVHDTAFQQNATNYQIFGNGLSLRNSNIGYSVINTSNILVNTVVNDVSAAVIPNQPTQNVTVSGWGYIQGNNTTSVYETVNLPYKFNNSPQITMTEAGYSGSAPTNLSSCSNLIGNMFVNAQAISTTSFSANLYRTDSQTISSTWYVCYTWTATGQVSPRQFVAVATGATSTDGGTTIINETDQTAVNVLVGSQHASVLWESNVALASNTLYSVMGNGTANGQTIEVYYGIAGLATSETSFEQYRNGGYSSGGGWNGLTGLYYLVTPSSATTIKSLSVTPGTSTIDGKSNTLYIGTDAGLSVLQEKQSGATYGDGSDESSGSVKYYTKDYISEEMVGDIRGMWPLSANGALSMSDASVKADTLTNNGTATAVTGVRGVGVSLNGSTQYLSCTDAACGGTSKLDSGGTAWSVGAWVNRSVAGTVDMIITKDDTSTNRAYSLYAYSDNKIYFEISTNGSAVTQAVSNTTLSASQWYYVVGTYDGSNMRLYINGTLEATTAKTGNIYDSTAAFIIGQRADLNAANYFSGYIDEAFVTANTLSASQIKHMYEVGYRALQSHAMTLGGGAADTNQQLGFISTGTNTVGAVGVDYNNQYMYVGLNSTTLGGLSKIDLNSDTNIKTFNSSANVPAGGTLLIDEDVNSVAVGYNLEAAGSAASGVKSMAPDNNANGTSGNFISKTTTTAESFTQAYLWAQYSLDSSDTSNTVAVWASNDGGTNYYQCNQTNTDTSQTPTEYEYFCQFNAAGSSLKTKFVFARGSTKTNTYLTRYGIAWIGSDAVGGAPGGNGLYTNNNSSVANGSYVEVAHNQNSNDVVTDGWVNLNGQWKDVSTATESGIVSASNASLADGSYVEVTHNQQTNAINATGWVNENSVWRQIDQVGGINHSSSDTGIRGWWKLEETSGNAADSSGNSNTLTANGGITYNQSSPMGFGTTFNGTSGYFSCTDASCGGTSKLDSGGTAWTVGAWIRRSATGAIQMILTKDDGSSRAYGLFANSDDTIHFEIYTAGGGNTAVSTTKIPANIWYFVVGTFDGSNIRLYINGQLENTAARTGSINDSTAAFVVGQRADLNASYYFNGAIDEPFVQATVLTADQIMQLYRLGISKDKFAITSPTVNTTRLYNYTGSTQNVRLDVSTQAFQIKQQDANTVRLYNYSGSTQNLRLDVITGGLGRNAGTVSLAPSAADVQSQDNLNAIWINQTGINGSLLKLQRAGSDILRISQAGGDAALILDQRLSGDIFTASASGTPKFVITNAGNVGIGTTTPLFKLDVAGSASFSGTLSVGPIATGSAGTCNAAAAGKQYFNGVTNKMNYCDGTNWTTMGQENGVISAFAGACPVGWTEYTASRGRTVVGTPASGTNAGTVGTALTNLEDRTSSHTHNTSVSATYYVKDGGSSNAYFAYDLTGVSGGSPTNLNVPAAGTFGSTSASVSTSNIIPYIQLTYCQKATGADLAEWVPASENISAATIVSADPANNEKLIASRKAYDQTVVGIVSTKPGWLIGDQNQGSVQMALSGRVPTQVSLVNGEIKRGDPITTSNIPGVGMKATQAGPIIGKAMEPLNEQSSVIGCGDGQKCGLIAVFVNVSWYDPKADSSQDSTVATDQFLNENLLVSETAQTGDVVNVHYDWVPDSVHPGDQVRQGVVYPSMDTDENSQETTIGVLGDGSSGEILQKIRQNGVLISQKSLITDGVTEVNLASTSAEIHQGDWLTLSEIRGQAKKSTQIEPIIGRALEDWKSTSGRAKIKIFVQPGTNLVPILAGVSNIGSLNDLVRLNTDSIASLSGQVATVSAQMEKLTTDVSGLLTQIPAIKSDLEILKEQMASVSGRLAKVENLKMDKLDGLDTESSISAVLDRIFKNSSSSASIFQFQDINVSTLSAQFATFSDSLKVIGKTQLADTSIGGGLTVGLLHFDDLKAEISSLTGLVTINSNLNVMGDATVSGTVRTKGVILKDTTTGDDYCVTIKNGEIDRKKGECQ